MLDKSKKKTMIYIISLEAGRADIFLLTENEASKLSRGI